MAKKLKSTHTLSDGRELKVFGYTGRDMLNANRIAKGDTMVMSFALVASRIEIDGKPQTFEDVADMDGDILSEVLVAVNPEAAEKTFT